MRRGACQSRVRRRARAPLPSEGSNRRALPACAIGLHGYVPAGRRGIDEKDIDAASMDCIRE
jgi:hypothetical protein